MLRFQVALVTTLAAGAPALAYAQTPLEQAKALAERATIEYQVGNFDQALALYSKAYEAYPKPELLFDIGQCHRMRKDYERAIFFYQGYLRSKPDAANRPLVERLLDDASKQLEVQRQSEAARAQAERPAPEQGAPSSPGSMSSTEPPSTGVVAVEPRAATGHPVLRISGLASAGAGVVLIGTAAYLGLHAASLSSRLSQVSSQHGTWSPAYESDYESGKSSARAATILYVIGGVALATGGVLTYLGWPRTPRDSRPVATVAPAPGGAAFVFAARF